MIKIILLSASLIVQVQDSQIEAFNRARSCVRAVAPHVDFFIKLNPPEVVQKYFDDRCIGLIRGNHPEISEAEANMAMTIVVLQEVYPEKWEDVKARAEWYAKRMGK
jgi:hypothetical protein